MIYTFFLESWKSETSLIPQNGRFRCEIHPNTIFIYDIQSEYSSEREISISSIIDCRMEYQAAGLGRYVVVVLPNGKILLTPVNPFDPHHILFTNHDEVKAMVNVINSFRSKNPSKLEINPYRRQLLTKRHPKISSHETLDINISPWQYNQVNGEKNIFLKILAGLLLGLLLAVPFILLIAYFIN